MSAIPARHTTIFELSLPYEKPPLSLNDRKHWGEESRIKGKLKDDVHWRAIEAKLPRNVKHADITLIWYPNTKHARDTDNPTATLKPCIDALVRYGLIVDDSSLLVSSRCVIAAGVHKPGRLVLSIEVVL